MDGRNNVTTSISNDTFTTSPLANSSHALKLSDTIQITIIVLIGFVGNSFAAIVFTGILKHKKRPPHVLVLSLTWIDLSATIMYLTVPSVLREPFKTAFGQEAYCNLFMLTNTVFVYSSGFVCVLMSVERAIALTRPFSYERIVTYERTRNTILAVVAIAVVCSVAPMIGFGTYYTPGGANGDCDYGFRYYSTALDITHLVIFLMFGFGMVICIIVCNGIVIRELLRMTKRVGDLPESQRQQPAQLAKFLGVIGIAFTICWLPLPISVVLSRMEIINSELHVVCIRFLAANHAVDPIIYFIMRKQFRMALKKLFYRLCCCNCCYCKQKINVESLSESNDSKS